MLHVQFQSYVGAIKEKWVEPSDVYPNLVRDWQQQADAYEALLGALEGKNYVNCPMSVGYWWDDAMDPFNACNPPGISQSVRGKLAEAVLGKWFAGGGNPFFLGVVLYLEAVSLNQVMLEVDASACLFNHVLFSWPCLSFAGPAVGAVGKSWENLSRARKGGACPPPATCPSPPAPQP